MGDDEGIGCDDKTDGAGEIGVSSLEESSASVKPCVAVDADESVSDDDIASGEGTVTVDTGAI